MKLFMKLSLKHNLLYASNNFFIRNSATYIQIIALPFSTGEMLLYVYMQASNSFLG